MCVLSGIWVWALEIDLAEVPRFHSGPQDRKATILLLDTEVLSTWTLSNALWGMALVYPNYV